MYENVTPFLNQRNQHYFINLAKFEHHYEKQQFLHFTLQRTFEVNIEICEFFKFRILICNEIRKKEEKSMGGEGDLSSERQKRNI